MRLEQRMKLAPHMIQSMEILQLPILALQERIEQELNSNPLLELEEPEASDDTVVEASDSDDEALAEKDLVVSADDRNVEDFERLDRMDMDLGEHIDQSGPMRSRSQDNDTNSKLQAIQNTAAPPQSLYQYLIGQWHLVDAEEPVKIAGETIIDYIDHRGYLTVCLEQLVTKEQTAFTLEDLETALALVQELEPAGVGARDIKECLLIQIAQSPDDMGIEAELVSKHMQLLLENRLPDIAKKMQCSMEEVNHAIEGLRKLDTSPGLQISQTPSFPITPDVLVSATDEGEYRVQLVDHNLPSLRLNSQYAAMAKDSTISETTKKFLRTNMRSAQWIIDAIEQRKNTLLRVTESIVQHQTEFFDLGPLHLKPLPMAKVADDVGVHVATVSRAVAGKHMQCAWGVLPLRKFFSGGKEDASGKEHSWEAIRGQLQKIIDNEDKAKPLNDDQIREKLSQAGFSDIARRTVAKYRGLLNIPTARFRKRFDA
ncbi:MAG: RNA polymerase factor sigma-54 [Phycisphaerae bacterium]|nr:RNA polymerase factor sigma-54 [Phycisphaerae bacterium]